jgi:uncharacterized protein YbaP (TraB family)
LEARCTRVYRAKLTLAFLLWAAFVLSQALAQDQPAVDEHSCLKEQSATAPRRGLFYEVSDGTHTVALFGTVHAGKPGFYPLHKNVIRALCQSQFLVLEADITDVAKVRSLVAELGIYPAGDSLDRHMPSALLDELVSALQDTNIRREQIIRMRPATLAFTLEGIGMQRAGYTVDNGVDRYLIKMATHAHIPLAEIESMRFQLELVNSLSPAEYQLWLRRDVESLVNGEFFADLTAFADAWNNSDLKLLGELLRKQLAKRPVAESALYQKLITDRNVAMTAAVEKFLQSDTRYFVAVGAAHLVGKDGIIARLTRAGYTVRLAQ